MGDFWRRLWRSLGLVLGREINSAFFDDPHAPRLRFYGLVIWSWAIGVVVHRPRTDGSDG